MHKSLPFQVLFAFIALAVFWASTSAFISFEMQKEKGASFFTIEVTDGEERLTVIWSGSIEEDILHPFPIVANDGPAEYRSIPKTIDFTPIHHPEKVTPPPEVS